MTNLQVIMESIEKAKKERFLIYDNPTSNTEKIVIDVETNAVSVVKVKTKVESCTCAEAKPCKHMLKLSMKLGIDVSLEKEKVVVKKKTTKKTASKAKLKIV